MLEIARLLSYLLRMSRNLNFSRPAVVVALVTGLLSGVGLTGLLAVISSAMAGGTGHRLLFSFIALCVVVPVSRLISQSLFNVLTTKAILRRLFRLSS